MNIDQPLSYENFVSEQEQAAKQLVFSLKMQWIVDIERVIQSRFKDESDGWFNLSEANPNNYHLGKLSSFFSLVKIQMQDTLFDLIRSNFTRYVDFIDSYIPKTTDIGSLIDVKNTYSDGYENHSKGGEDFKRTHIPLFTIDLQIVDNEVRYSEKPSYFEGTVLKTFKKTLEGLGMV